MALDVLNLALWLVAGALFVFPALVLVQIVAARGVQGAVVQAPAEEGRRPRVGVLVPAHDEVTGIARTLESILPQLLTGDRLLVVADNCTDATAAVARATGAEAIERTDPARRGKGYALDFGVRHFEADPPEVVLVIDADCRLHAGSLDRLARLCGRVSRPVQALDIMVAPPGAPLKTRIAAFAWVVKNHARPLGTHRLGLPCQLMGTGMALPWALIRNAPLATGHLVEDMRLGLDLAAAGAAPLFCPEAQVSSTFPIDEAGIADQRARWEGGHLSVILGEAPRALWHALRQRRFAVVAMVLDLSVPPLTMLAMLLCAQVLVDAFATAVLGAHAGPFAIALASLALFVAAVMLAWGAFGRSVVSATDLAGVLRYAGAKLPLYARLLMRRKVGWTRARRDDQDD